MENNHDIDKAFNEASKNSEEPATFPGFDKVWAKVEKRLDQKEVKKRKNIPLWIPYGVAASLLVVSGIFYFTHEKQNKEIQQEVIATHTDFQKESPAATSSPVQRIDSLVKMNIQSETMPVPSERAIAYQAAPKLNAPLPASPIAEMSVVAASRFESAQAAEQQKMAMDSVRRQNIEEVIAMGIKKEKASMGALASSQKVSGLNAVGDTAESFYPDLALNLKEKEFNINNKRYVKTEKPFSFQNLSSGLVGEKADPNVFKDMSQGARVNSVPASVNPVKPDVTIKIRGTGNAAQDPMLVIDGKVSDMKTFSNLDPQKIESVTVLKANQAAPLFSGEKARNGVIVVITKSISRKEKQKLKKFFNEKLLKE